MTTLADMHPIDAATFRRRIDAAARATSTVDERATADWGDDNRFPVTGFLAEPLGCGVDFFLSDAMLAFPMFDMNVRQDIAVDAFEAAREVIVSGLADHARRIMPVVAAVADYRVEGSL